MRAYLAAPIFTERDRNFNTYLEQEILKRCPDLDLYLAQNNASINDKTGCANSADIYVGDVTRLKEADLLITVMSGDLPPIGSSYEVAYYCGLCEKDPKKRIIALYDDCREATRTYSEDKRDAMLGGIAENQFPYINLLAVGFVKKWGNIYNNSADLIDAVENQYKIGFNNLVTGIYKITNLKNGMMYIGQSNDIYKRWREHCHNSDKKSAISNAINTYGKDYFKFEIIESCADEELQSREKYWIEYYDAVNTGYNIQNSSTNTLMNPSWHQQEVYGYELDGTFFKKFDTIVDAAHYINRSTAGIQTCLRYNDNQHSSGGKMWFVDYHGKQIEPYIKLPHGHNKMVYAYDLETRMFVKCYSSHTEACKAMGSNNNKSHINDVINGNRNSCFGYLWSDKFYEVLPYDYYKHTEEK